MHKREISPVMELNSINIYNQIYDKFCFPIYITACMLITTQGEKLLIVLISLLVPFIFSHKFQMFSPTASLKINFFD